MFERFIEFYGRLNGVSQGSRILLTVSGGVDSMVMLRLFSLASLDFSVAHCNFQLRGEESERDMEFVESECEKLGVRLFVKRFDTEAYAAANKISIQMAARDLRYRWFEELRDEEGFDFIATAHHLDDQAETFFINLVRGTGIAGLHGIKASTGNIIRPLMFAQRHEIISFAMENNVDFVEDSSNMSDKYLRNHIRHNILPLFNALNPHFISNLARTINDIALIENEFKKYAKTIFKGMLKLEGNKIIIDIPDLLKIDNLKLYLGEFLSQYGFNDRVIESVYEALSSSKSGMRFFSGDYRLIKNRNELIIIPLQENYKDESADFYLIDEDFKANLPLKLTFSLSKGKVDFNSNPNHAYFDFDKLKFPLVLRKWQQGDVFYPFGMKGKKLVSDYFTDNKFSLVEKEEAWLLCSGNDIIWIVGHRSDNRFKVDKDTEKILVAEYQNGID